MFAGAMLVLTVIGGGVMGGFTAYCVGRLRSPRIRRVPRVACGVGLAAAMAVSINVGMWGTQTTVLVYVIAGAIGAAVVGIVMSFEDLGGDACNEYDEKV